MRQCAHCRDVEQVLTRRGGGGVQVCKATVMMIKTAEASDICDLLEIFADVYWHPTEAFLNEVQAKLTACVADMPLVSICTSLWAFAIFAFIPSIPMQKCYANRIEEDLHELEPFQICSLLWVYGLFRTCTQGVWNTLVGKLTQFDLDDIDDNALKFFFQARLVTHSSCNTYTERWCTPSEPYPICVSCLFDHFWWVCSAHNACAEFTAYMVLPFTAHLTVLTLTLTHPRPRAGVHPAEAQHREHAVVPDAGAAAQARGGSVARREAGRDAGAGDGLREGCAARALTAQHQYGRAQGARRRGPLRGLVVRLAGSCCAADDQLHCVTDSVAAEHGCRDDELNIS
jgi:hypothetical protein